MLRACSLATSFARRYASSKAAAPSSILSELKKVAEEEAKRPKKGGKGSGSGGFGRVPHQALIPLTNIELEDPILPPITSSRRPYPLPDAKTTTGKPAEYRTLKAFLRTVFTSGSGKFARDNMGLVPITILGDTPGRKGQNPLHLLVSRRDLELELKEAGVYTRMFKFNISDNEAVPSGDVSNNAHDILLSVQDVEKHTIALLRTVDMNPLTHECVSAVFKRFVPGKGVAVKVPVQFLNANVCPGSKKGGIVLYVRHALKCMFRGDALPNYDDISIKVDLQSLEVGSRIRLKDVELPPGCTPYNPNANVIFVTCKKITAELGATKSAEEETAAV